MRRINVIRVGLAASVIIAGCATQQPEPKPQPVVVQPATKPAPAPQVAAPAPKAAPASQSSARTMDAYKRDVAKQIVAKNSGSVAESLPPILKSVVVLDITLDSEGKAANIMVRRSNGYRDLEQTAIESVRRAGPFPAPSADVLNGSNVISYTETWLFRPDGRFQVRSVAEVQDLSVTGSVAKKK